MRAHLDQPRTVSSGAGFVAMLFCLILLGGLNGGCGTEVGNGHSGPPKDDLPKANSTSGDPDTSAQGPAPAAYIPESAPDFSDPIYVLLNNCASPFGDRLPSDVLNLRASSSDQQSAFTLIPNATLQNANVSVRASNGKGNTFAVKPLGSYKTSVTSTYGQAVTVPYTCIGSVKTSDATAPGTSTSALSHRISLTLEQTGAPFDLTWYTDKADPTVILRVEISRGDGPSLVLLPDNH